MAKATDKLFVNVYIRDRIYGGPEEGGWWFDSGVPEENQKAAGGATFYNDDAAYRHCRMLNSIFTAEAQSRGSRGNVGSVMFDYDFVAQIETHPARFYPQQRPHYE